MDHLGPIRTATRYLAAALALGSAALTFLFGYESFGLIVALCLVVASIGSAYIWPVVLDEWRNRRFGIAAFVGIVAAVFTITDLTTNFGSITSKRGEDIQTASLQNTRYDDVRASLDDQTATQKLLEQRLGRLEARSDWQPEKPVDAWAAEIAVMEGDKLFGSTRTKGCTDATLPDSRAFCADYASAKAGLAMAEEHARVVEMLTATKAALASARERAATVDKQISGAEMQNTALASMLTLSLTPDAASQHWTDKGVAWMVALFLTIGALGLNLIGWAAPGAPQHLQIRKTPAWDDKPQPAPAQVHVVSTTVGDLARARLQQLRGAAA